MEFVYTGVDKNSQRTKGKLEANNEKEVIDFLRSTGITPLTLRKMENFSSPLLPGGVGTSDIVLFTRQLASMVMTGLTLMEALKVLKDQGNKPRMQAIITDLINQLSEGISFSEALSAHKNVFSNVYIALIRAAEKGGLFDKVLARLADNMEKEEDFKKRVKSAMFYPAIVVSGVIAVIVVMNIFVIPQLGTLYESLKLELPFSTKVVLAISKLFTTFWPLLLLSPIGAVIFYKRLKKTTEGIKIIDRVKLKIPVFGSINNLSVLDEVSRTLSLLIGSGVSIIESLNITASIADNYWYRTSILTASAMVEKGVSLSDSLSHSNMFPPMLIQMVRVGESTGRIDETLLKVSEYFERDLDVKVKTVTTAIEPILIIVLGISVAFLILSVITPIYSLISQIQ